MRLNHQWLNVRNNIIILTNEAKLAIKGQTRPFIPKKIFTIWF